MNKILSNRKIICLVILVLLILGCALWSSFKIETFSDYDFYSSELKTNYKDILNSKHVSAYEVNSDLGYLPRLINDNNLQNTNQTTFLDNMTDKMNVMEYNLNGMLEKPKYYSGNVSSPITKDDPKGFLRPRKETIQSNDHYQ